MRFLKKVALAFGLAATLLATSTLAPALAQTELPIATFPFPSVSNIIADIIWRNTLTKRTVSRPNRSSTALAARCGPASPKGKSQSTT
jgi:hypothetical protein